MQNGVQIAFDVYIVGDIVPDKAESRIAGKVVFEYGDTSGAGYGSLFRREAS